MVFFSFPGWCTVAPPMLAFLYCFAQIGLEWTSHPPWVTLTLYRSENPRHQTTRTARWGRCRVLTSLCGEPGSQPQRPSKPGWSAAEQPLFRTCKTGRNLSVSRDLNDQSWFSLRRVSLLQDESNAVKPGQVVVAAAAVFEACFLPNKLLWVTFIPRNCKIKYGPWISLGYMTLIQYCSVVR